MRGVKFLKVMVAGLALMAVPTSAQIRQIDPNDADSYAAGAPQAQAQADASGEYEAPPPEPEYAPIGDSQPTATPAAPAPVAPAPQGETIPKGDVFSAAENVFGKGAKGLAEILEKILADQGEPVAYIAGQEAGGAFVVGLRYGSGTMRHKVEGDKAVYWTGPSIGFDAGADASKVFVLVYNLNDTHDLYRAYAAAEGNAYFVGGFKASYLRRGDVVLIPVRLGVGLRLGVNAGYMRFSEKGRWLPF